MLDLLLSFVLCSTAGVPKRSHRYTVGATVVPATGVVAAEELLVLFDVLELTAGVITDDVVVCDAESTMLLRCIIFCLQNGHSVRLDAQRSHIT